MDTSRPFKSVVLAVVGAICCLVLSGAQRAGHTHLTCFPSLLRAVCCVQRPLDLRHAKTSKSSSMLAATKSAVRPSERAHSNPIEAALLLRGTCFFLNMLGALLPRASAVKSRRRQSFFGLPARRECRDSGDYPTRFSRASCRVSAFRRLQAHAETQCCSPVCMLITNRAAFFELSLFCKG